MILATYGTMRSVFAANASVATTALDGYKTWPVAKLNTAGFRDITRPTSTTYGSAEIIIHANGTLTADAAFGVDEVDWYLSQRTDTAANQMLSITAHPPSGGFSYSRTVHLGITSLGTTTFPIASEDRIRGVYKHVAVYCSRRSDGAIQCVVPLNTLLAAVS